MRTSRVQSRVVLFIVAILMPLQISPAAAGGAPKSHDDHRRVDVTFTKWVTTYPAMAGYTGGDIVGEFVGEVLDLKSGTLPVISIEAIYTVEAGRHSFVALVKGGQNIETGAALLEGVVLGGWRTGAKVHVEFQQESNCAGAPDGDCFVGTIHIK